MDRTPKDYSQPYETPYYAELKRCGIRLPCFLTHIRTDAARIEKPKDARMFRMLFLTPRADGCCGTIDTSAQTNLIMTHNDMETTPAYHEHPTKEDLLEYFSHRIRIRKMTPTEALRLMDVADPDIGRMKAAGIAKTNLYKLAGNSIVVSCLYHILRTLRTLLIPGQPENAAPKSRQLTIFDI